MHKNFTTCPHCFANGKDRVIRPATPHRTPLVSRSDGSSFHLFVEESYVRRVPNGSNFEVVALFRYDLDPAGVKVESSLVQIPLTGSDATEVMEKAADALAAMLAKGVPLKRVYSATELRMDGESTLA